MEQKVNLEVKQYVVFKLGREEYGIDIIKVTTIEKVMPIARVPKTPAYIKGVINLRGEIIPIIDLRTRFNLPEIEATEDTRIIIVKIDEISVGFVVDAVDEVMQLTENSVESLSSFSNDLSMDYILGVGKIDNRIVTLLNLEILIKMVENP
jgi:purine-binding chemotaxis protein CheW